MYGTLTLKIALFELSSSTSNLSPLPSTLTSISSLGFSPLVPSPNCFLTLSDLTSHRFFTFSRFDIRSKKKPLLSIMPFTMWAVKPSRTISAVRYDFSFAAFMPYSLKFIATTTTTIAVSAVSAMIIVRSIFFCELINSPILLLHSWRGFLAYLHHCPSE